MILSNPDAPFALAARAKSVFRATSATQLWILLGQAAKLLVFTGLLIGSTVLASATYDCQISEGILHGTITYLERMALPRSAKIHVVLVEVRDQNEEAVICEKTFATDGRQVPIPFAIRYPLAVINPKHKYLVRAEIAMLGETWFVTREPVPVLTQGNSNEAKIVVSRSS